MFAPGSHDLATGFTDTTHTRLVSSKAPVGHTYEIDLLDVKRAFRDLADGKPIPREMGTARSGIFSYLMPAFRTPDIEDGWLGGSTNQTLGWMRDGFTSDDIKTAAKRVAMATRRRARYNQLDGTPVLERLYGGDPAFFQKRTPKKVKPGLTINADMWFAGATSAKVIGEYGGFLAAIVQSLETRGFDLEVNLVTDVGKLMQGEPGRSQIFTRVKKRGEKARFGSWSCVLAPTGFRMLMFLGFHVAGAKYGKQPTNHLAQALDRSEWSLTYNAKTHEIRITAAQMSGRSGFEKLMADAKLAGLI